MKKLITYLLIVCLSVGLYPFFSSPQKAAAGGVGGGAYGAQADVSVDLIVPPSITVTLPPVAPVTLPVGGGGPFTDSVASASAGAAGLPVLTTGIITNTTTGTVTAGGSTAASSSTVDNPNVLGGFIIADKLVATANSSCNGITASSSGSLVATNLVVNGGAPINGSVAPNTGIATTITLPVIGTVAATVTLNEQIPTGDGLLTSGITVNAIHVAASGATIAGTYNVDIIIASASSSVICMGNTAPSITPVPAGQVTRQQGSPGTVSTIATVSDPEDPAGSLTITTVAPLPTGITVTGITNTNGTITATVAADCSTAAGTNNVQLRVTDSDGTMTTATFVINVTANTGTTVGAYPNASVASGQSTTVTPAAAPADNGSIASVTASTVPGFTGTLSGNAATGAITAANAGPVGVYTINVVITDNCGLTTPASFQLTVNNNGPSITAPPPGTIVRQEGSPGTTSTIATVSDPDQSPGTLVVTVVSAPPGITVTDIVNTNGTVTATIAATCAATPGTNTVVVQVADSNGNTSTVNLTINVTANTAPTVGAYPNASVTLGQSTTVTPAAAPADNGSIASVTATTAPGFTGTLSGNAATGAITAANAGPAGVYTINVVITDNCGATTPASFTLNVGCGITVTPATLINGLTFVPYSATLSATGGSGSYTFSLTSGTLPAGLTLSGNVISGTPNTAGASTFTIRATDSNGCFGDLTYTLLIGSTGLMYYPLDRPVRLLDTRPGFSPDACFLPNAPIPGGTVRTQPVRGTCKGLTIPSEAISITGNITSVQSGGGFLAIYPSDAPQPLVSNSNYMPNEIVNNAFVVGIGADGAVKISVSTTTDVVVDVTGYYAMPGAGGLYFHPLPRPVRLLETRVGYSGCFAPAAPLPGGVDTLQQGTGSCQGLTIPPEAQALVGNATTVNPVELGYLTLYPADAARPLISSSNYNAGQTVNGPFTVGLSPSGQFKIFPQFTTDLVIDITGYYSTQIIDVNGPGLLYSSLGSPLRLLDTRAGQQGCYTPGAPMIGGTVYTQDTQSPCTNLTPTARALVGNATVVNTTAEGYLTFWPGDAAQPLVANSNFVAGQVINRYFTVGLGPDASFKRFANRTTDLVIDISGFFAP